MSDDGGASSPHSGDEGANEVETKVDANAPPKRGGTVRFSVQITARLANANADGNAAGNNINTLHDPCFRFQFIDGTKVITSPVGTEGDGDDSANANANADGSDEVGVWTRRPTIQKPKEEGKSDEELGLDDLEVRCDRSIYL